MKKCITIGIIHSSFKYILLTIFFYILNRSFYGYNFINDFEEINIFKNIFKLFDLKIKENFPKNKLIHQIFHYIGIIIFGYCCHRYEIYVNKREIKLSQINNSDAKRYIKHSTKIILIHNKEEKFFDLKKSIIKCIIICTLWVIEENLILIYKETLKDLDFWFLDILIISYFNSKIFKVIIYKHQKFAIIFNIIPSLLKLFTIIISWTNKDQSVIYINYKWLIPLGFILFIILITIRAYVNSEIKRLIDLKYVSSNTLLIVFGFTGSFISIICLIISTYNNCNGIEKINKNMYQKLCNVNWANSNNNESYYDSFKIYFNNYKVTDCKDIIIEIIIIILGMITMFGHKYCYIAVIKYLTPVHLIFSIPIYYFFEKLFLVFNTLIICGTIFKEHIELKKYELKFLLDISGDILSFFGFLIYLEIIEMNFCSFEYNTKKNITGRSYDESYGISKVNDRNNSTFNNEIVEEIINNEDLSSSYTNG